MPLLQLLQPSGFHRSIPESEVLLETLVNFLTSLKQRAQDILLMFDHLLRPNHFQTTPLHTDLHTMEI